MMCKSTQGENQNSQRLSGVDVGLDLLRAGLAEAHLARFRKLYLPVVIFEHHAGVHDVLPAHQSGFAESNRVKQGDFWPN